MRWLNQADTGANADPLTAYTASTLENCLGDMLSDELPVHDVASAVSEYLREAGVDQAAFDRGLLVMLAAQALAACGDREASCRLLLFGTGLARPAVWEFSGARQVWTLDLRQATISDSGWLELNFFPLLSRIVEAVSEVWDGTDGDGALGLRHVCQAARMLLGSSVSSCAAQELGKEALRHCRAVLLRVGSERGWSSTPAVINLDVS